MGFSPRRHLGDVHDVDSLPSLHEAPVPRGIIPRWDILPRWRAPLPPVVRERMKAAEPPRKLSPFNRACNEKERGLQAFR